MKNNQGGSRRCAWGAALITQERGRLRRPRWLHRPHTHAHTHTHITLGKFTTCCVHACSLSCRQVGKECFLAMKLCRTVRDICSGTNEGAVCCDRAAWRAGLIYFTSLFELNAHSAPSQKQNLDLWSSIQCFKSSYMSSCCWLCVICNIIGIKVHTTNRNDYIIYRCLCVALPCQHKSHGGKPPCA